MPKSHLTALPTLASPPSARSHNLPVGPYLIERSAMPWANDGSCAVLARAATSPTQRKEIVDLFFGEYSTGPALALERRKKAKSLCRACPVRAECLTHALLNNEREGMWGGEADIERRTTRKRLRATGMHHNPTTALNWVVEYLYRDGEDFDPTTPTPAESASLPSPPAVEKLAA